MMFGISLQLLGLWGAVLAVGSPPTSQPFLALLSSVPMIVGALIIVLRGEPKK